MYIHWEGGEKLRSIFVSLLAAAEHVEEVYGSTWYSSLCICNVVEAATWRAASTVNSETGLMLLVSVAQDVP